MTMIKHRMEIKVALLGNVSAGKTTVLNALLQNKYGEVAKKRTTAGANYFYLNVAKDVNDKVEHHLAESIHQEITEDNRNKVRDGHEIIKKEFDIEMPEPIVRCRKDTVLVLVDIPGINEAGTENKYKEFVSENWTTFDCVIVVMDGKQGVNTEDQVFLLKFVKENLVNMKNVPVIILCNKIDDPLEEEQAELVKEARNEVEKIFDVQCREISLLSVIEKYKKNENFEARMSPAFIPVSAGNAFIYRCGYQMTLEQFENFDKTVIDGFGRSHFGKKSWNMMSVENRMKTVFTLVSDHNQYVEGMKECNFDVFMNVLDTFVGGEDRQKILIQEQVKHSLLSVSLEPFTVGKITQAVRTAHIHLSALGLLANDGGVEFLQRSFWESHKKIEESVFKQFKDSWPTQNVNMLAGPMKELSHYFDFIVEMKLEGEKSTLLSKGEALVCRYFKFLLEKHIEMKRKPDPKFSSYDWFMIFESILLLSCNHCFCQLFAQAKIEFTLRSYQALEMTKTPESVGKCSFCNKPRMTNHFCDHGDGNLQRRLGRPHYSNIPCKSCHCDHELTEKVFPQVERNYGDNDVSLDPLDLVTYKKWVHVQPTKLLSDANHFGHLPFEFCQLSERINATIED